MRHWQAYIPAAGAFPCISAPPGARPGLTWQRGPPVLHQCKAPLGKMRGEEGRSPAQKLFTSIFRISAPNLSPYFCFLTLSLLPLVVRGEPPASNAPTVKTTPPAPSRDLERSAAWEEPQHSAKCQSSVFIFSPPSDSTLVLQVLDGEMKKTDLFI